MKAYSYVPFQGELDTLKGPELAALKGVCEGWYVDYKESVPAVKALAKHISAFANQHGGWIFLGVKEKEGKGMTADTFPGIPAASVPAVQVAIREAASTHSTPPPYFETKVIYGPVSELDLLPNRAILIVGIPKGTNPPYIHSSGRIYRRVADESDPKPETDRQVLDLLWERGARTRQRLKDFLSERPTLSEEEKSGPLHAYVYFLADPLHVGHHFPLAYDEFASVMKASAADSQSVIVFSLPNTYPTSEGFIARQVEGNDPTIETLTFRWWSNGNVRISIPINTYDFKASKGKLDQLQLEFLHAIESRGYKSGRIAEFSLLVAIIAAMADKYLRLRKSMKIREPFFGKIRIYDTWRVIPYINMRSYIRRISDRGFPVVQDQSLTCPPGLASHNLVEMNESMFTDDQTRPFLTVLPLVLETLRAVGLEFSSLDENFDKTFFEELVSSVADSLDARQIR